MLVHNRVTSSIKFSGNHLYISVEWGTVRLKFLVQFFLPGLGRRPLDPGRNAVAMRPPKRTTKKTDLPPCDPKLKPWLDNWLLSSHKKVFSSAGRFFLITSVNMYTSDNYSSMYSWASRINLRISGCAIIVFLDISRISRNVSLTMEPVT